MVLLHKNNFNTQSHQNCLQQTLLQEYLKKDLEKDNKIYFNIFESEIFDKLFVEVCQACSKMSSLPAGALFVRKLRETGPRENETLLSHMKAVNKENQDTNNVLQDKQLLDYNPVKYNEKLMKSIWGQYNRYSPHNIKTNNYEKDQQISQMQQQIAVAGAVIADKLAMALRSGSEWCFGKH